MGTHMADSKSLKTSIIIPCYYKHVDCLDFLLEQYANQTTLPDEVVVVVSQADKVESSVLRALQEQSWPYMLQFITTNKVQFAGQNRNTGCKHARGDVFILQDADDLPHPQRVEIIKYFFEHFEVDHLMHGYFEVGSSKRAIPFTNQTDLSTISLFWDQRFERIWGKLHCHNGNIAISKKLFERVQWTAKRRGQDTEFNKEVYAQKNNCLCIKVPLVCYRYYLSASPELNLCLKQQKLNRAKNNKKG